MLKQCLAVDMYLIPERAGVTYPSVLLAVKIKLFGPDGLVLLLYSQTTKIENNTDHFYRNIQSN